MRVLVSTHFCSRSVHEADDPLMIFSLTFQSVVCRLTAALALFLYLSPFHKSLDPFAYVLDVKENLQQKLLPGGCRATGVTRMDVRALVKEASDKLCLAFDISL